MSTCPGTDLESFVMWNHDLIVDNDNHANLSLSIVEAMGGKTRRMRITTAKFAPVIALYESSRDYIERQLENYNEEENGSWRDYAGSAFDYLPQDLYDKVNQLLLTYKEPPADTVNCQ